MTSATINVDSLACILALKTPKITSQLVLSTVSKLNEAAKSLSNGLTIRWCQSHQDHSEAHRGNAHADELARSGAELRYYNQLVPEDELPLRPPSALKSDIHFYVKKAWNKRWKDGFRRNPTCEQTKNWLPEINYSWSRKLLLGGKSRIEYSIALQFVSGHNYLLEHESRIRGYPSPICRLCQEPGSKEDTEHIMSICESLAYIRFQTLLHPFPPKPWDYIPVWRVLGFLRKAPIQFLPFCEE